MGKSIGSHTVGPRPWTRPAGTMEAAHIVPEGGSIGRIGNCQLRTWRPSRACTDSETGCGMPEPRQADKERAGIFLLSAPWPCGRTCKNLTFYSTLSKTLPPSWVAFEWRKSSVFLPSEDFSLLLGPASTPWWRKRTAPEYHQMRRRNPLIFE